MLNQSSMGYTKMMGHFARFWIIKSLLCNWDVLKDGLILYFSNIDSILAGTKDRELQFLILKLAICSRELPKFKFEQLSEYFIKLNFKSFKTGARKFLDKVDIYHKKE